MISAAVRAHLLANPGSPTLTTSIYPEGDVDQDAPLPRITLRTDTDEEQTLLDGTSVLKTALVDVDCWSLRKLEAAAMAESVTEALRGYRGDFGDYTADHIRRERYFELFESDTRLHRASLQFFIAYY